MHISNVCIRQDSEQQFNFYSAIDKEYGAGLDGQHRILLIKPLQPILKLVLRDKSLLTFIFFSSSAFTPVIELLICNSSSLDPGKAFFVFSAVSLKGIIICLTQCPLLERANLAATLLTFRNRTLAILRADAACLGKIAPAVLAAADSDTTLHTGPKRVVDHVRNAGRVENRRTPAFFRRLKADRDWAKLEQLRISEYVVIIVVQCLLLRIASGLIHIQNQFKASLNLLLILR